VNSRIWFRAVDDSTVNIVVCIITIMIMTMIIITIFDLGGGGDPI